MALHPAMETEAAAEARSRERELIERILRGEKQIFHELVRPYERSVYLTAFSVLKNHADAEEAAQETMIRAFRHISQLKCSDKFKPWLLKIAVNQARLKRRAAHAHLFEPIEGDNKEEPYARPRDFADWRENPLELVERKEIREKVLKALQGLPEIYRETFLLRDVQQLSVDECCQLLGQSSEVIKVRLHRARLMMRERLAPVFKKPWLDRIFSARGRKTW